MFTDSASFYDLVYSFKDYRSEAAEIGAMIRSRHPGCTTILDVGCGTAEHHRYLKDEFQIDGIDINEDFIHAAAQKNIAGSYHVADMTDFSLDKKYDVITCLFSSIGYVTTRAGLVATLQRFSKHLDVGGLVMVEPWFTPEVWREGLLHMITYDRDELKICRMNRSETNGHLSIMNFHYLVGTPEEGVRHFEERHVLALYSREEMRSAFRDANFEVKFDENGLIGRGMYFAYNGLAQAALTI